jgi:hypothetical protein
MSDPTSIFTLPTLARSLAVAALFSSCSRPDVVEHESDPSEQEQDDGELTKLAFDADTVQTMRGTVMAVEPFQHMRGTRRGLRIKLKTDDETLYVYLAPIAYLDRNEMSISRGAEVEVAGSILDGDGRRVVIATEITKGGKTLTLRDAEGRPAWRHWRGPAKT